MKFYILKHSNSGYLAGNSKNKHFVLELEKSRKFNRRSDAANCKNTSYYLDSDELEVIEIKYEIV